MRLPPIAPADLTSNQRRLYLAFPGIGHVKKVGDAFA